MNKILSFAKPKKVLSTEEHNNNYSSDSGVAGTYVPNMSKEDNERFKAKHIKGSDERVEIRVGINGVNVLIKVFKHKKKTKNDDWRERQNDHNEIQMSMNGKLDIDYDVWEQLHDATEEALALLDGRLEIEDFN